MSTQLQIRALSCERGQRRLFAGLDCELSSGDALLLEGSNGVGKTTLLRCLAGLSVAYTGSVLWCGRELRAAPYRAGDLLYIGHAPGIKAVLSPRENLRWWAALNNSALARADSAALDAALCSAGLEAHLGQHCYRLSSGQQRRAALARLYLSQHRLWVLDEPFTALDRRGVAELEQCIQRHRQRGGVVVMSSHQAPGIDFSRRLDLADYVTETATLGVPV